MNFSGEFIVFFILAIVTIGGAIFMINLTKVVHMVISLALTLVGIAGIFFLLDAEFLAVVQVLIYSGAVTILMLFGIMLTRHRDEDALRTSPWHNAISFVAVAGLFAFLMWGIYSTAFPNETADVSQFTVKHLGTLVFKHYVVPFELTSVLLLVALIGAIVLAKKEAD